MTSLIELLGELRLERSADLLDQLSQGKLHPMTDG